MELVVNVSRIIRVSDSICQDEFRLEARDFSYNGPIYTWTWSHTKIKTPKGRAAKLAFPDPSPAPRVWKR